MSADGQTRAAAGPASQPCVFVSNLTHNAVGDNIKEAFAAKGIDVARVEIMKKGAPFRRRGAGLAVVALERAADSRRCCELLDGKPLLGRPMIVRRDRFEEDDAAYQPPEAAVQPGAAGGGGGGGGISSIGGSSVTIGSGRGVAVT
ncbi:hypothetical protein Rsub_06482 [Raphidocelis subcapitata]|uniref:RRM domain-containing protein n=1 Tax=Raphidocelis subcapitata TaxID=307507 RepID=A0A2V0P5K7_9CHLO|nr:hypothetical protein Rsub_06482 [Raphidocelis subcapitata]|eukprot:GBF94212.1 hypothetical protein Rsub_06482 [Raphidocelis subcapitata]